ncbi:MAG: endonuclease/exonuclease/phosphatase family protein [Leptolyngbyaceae cyanobacterium]
MKGLITLLTVLLMLLGGGLIALVIFYFWASSGRLSAAEYAQVKTTDAYPLKTAANELVVVSYNIGYLSGLTNNQAVRPPADLYQTNLASAIAALAPLEADILALQEIDLASRRSYQVDQVEALGAALQYPQRAIAINWDKRYVPFPFWPPAVQFGQILSGQSILSRWPITQHERFVLDQVASNPFFYNALYLDRLAQVAQVDIAGQTVVVINLHLEAFDLSTRQTQTEFVLALAESYAEQYPVLLLGDFNSALNRDAEGTPRTIQTLIEAATFTSAVPPDQFTEPEHLTFPADKPEFRLDYIFYNPNRIELLNVEVLTTAGQASDHLPVVMRLRLR